MGIVNECMPFYRPGQNLTGYAAASALVGKTLCAITADMTSPPDELSDTPDGGTITVGLPSAGGRVVGAVKYNVARYGLVPIIGGGVVPVTTGDTIDAFEEVEVTAAGLVIPLAQGIAVGVCLNGTASGDDAPILLYSSPGGAGITVDQQDHIPSLTDNSGGTTGNDTLEAVGQPVKVNQLAGAAAGDHTLAAIAADDTILYVGHHHADAALADLTSEFTAAAGKITNALGTNTAGDELLVIWIDKSEADKVKNDLADLAAKVNALIVALEDAQVLKTS